MKKDEKIVEYLTNIFNNAHLIIISGYKDADMEEDMYKIRSKASMYLLLMGVSSLINPKF